MKLFDRVKAMKRWMAAGDINLAAFFNRLNLLHQDFSGLQHAIEQGAGGDHLSS